MSANNKRPSMFRIVIRKMLAHGVLPTLILILYRLIPYLFRAIPLRPTEVRSTDYDTLISQVYDYMPEEGDNHGGLISGLRKSFSPTQKRMIWFVPNWSNVWGGGHFTLFRFAHRIQKTTGIENIIFVYDNKGYHKDGKYLESDLRTALPDTQLRVITEKKDLPDCDVALATTWQSAYSLKNFQRTKDKFYFMQDYESLFYPGGTQAMQANLSYTFGFTGITGGHWLRSIYESYGNKAQNYVFATDRDIFYPAPQFNEQIKRIFFYGRPSTERRAFELGMACLKEINDRFPEVEIVVAGLGGLNEPPFPCTMLGNLSLKKTGELYRTCDIGIAFSGTNLSYLPVELMASGVPVVTNSGPQTEWFCKNEENALVVDPTPSAVLNAVERLAGDINLRKKLAAAGIEKTSRNTWDSEIDGIFKYIQANSSL